MSHPSTGPWHEDLCLPPLPRYHVVPQPGDPDAHYVAYCREMGDQVVTLSVGEARWLIEWFLQWHPDTFELALRAISKQRAQEPAVRPLAEVAADGEHIPGGWSVTGHASDAERLEIMRLAYRRVFGAELPEPGDDGGITLLRFSRRGDQVVVSIRVSPPGDPGVAD